MDLCFYRWQCSDLLQPRAAGGGRQGESIARLHHVHRHGRLRLAGVPRGWCCRDGRNCRDGWGWIGAEFNADDEGLGLLFTSNLKSRYDTH